MRGYNSNFDKAQSDSGSCAQKIVDCNGDRVAEQLLQNDPDFQKQEITERHAEIAAESAAAEKVRLGHIAAGKQQ